MKDFLSNIKNELDFFLKNTLKFSKNNYTENLRSEKQFYFQDEQKETENYLLKKYPLNEYKNSINTKTYIQNIYMLSILDQYFPQENHESIKILDLGAKNFVYLFALASFFSQQATDIKIKGIEIDANKLDANFYSRKEIANYYTAKVKNAEYVCEDFLNNQEKFDIIIWILPFLFKNPLLKWGLPLKFFCPEKMLTHAYESLDANGKIFIINQGEDEYLEQIRLCNNFGIKYELLGEIKSIFNPFEKQFFGLIIKKC